MSDLKAQHFLTIVQSVVTANCITLSADDKEKKMRHTYSATGVFIIMDEAVRASTMIPEKMTAATAANEFCFFMLDNLREEGSRVPGWFMRT